jgi:hypothetical protein
MQEPDQCLANATQTRKFIDAVILFAEKFYTRIPPYEICVVKFYSSKYLDKIHFFIAENSKNVVLSTTDGQFLSPLL